MTDASHEGMMVIVATLTVVPKRWRTKGVAEASQYHAIRGCGGESLAMTVNVKHKVALDVSRVEEAYENIVKAEAEVLFESLKTFCHKKFKYYSSYKLHFFSKFQFFEFQGFLVSKSNLIQCSGPNYRLL